MFDALHTLLASPRPWGHLHPPPAPSETHAVTTDDGLTLTLRHVPPEGEANDRPPVMLLHGLAANHRGFHLRERSLADWLAARGHDVWLPELRGHGDSPHDGYNWRLDDYLEYDLPAILEAIQRQTDRDGLMWVGHSMGGILLLCYGMLYPDNPIVRGVTVGSAIDYRIGQTEFERLLAIRPLLERLGAVPYGTLVHLIAPMMGRGPDALVDFNCWPSNIEGEIARALHARCFHSIPTSLLSSLATTFEDEGLRLESGFRFTERGDRLNFPVRLVAGSRDQQVDADSVAHTADLLETPTEVVVHGKDRGDADHYGHWDLLVGRRAEEETWPGIAQWLER